MLHEIAAARSGGLLTLAALLVALAAAWIIDSIGLSMALGAFLGGMMLGETEFRHQLETEIRPFRDVLLGMLLVTMGMLPTKFGRGITDSCTTWFRWTCQAGILSAEKTNCAKCSP